MPPPRLIEWVQVRHSPLERGGAIKDVVRAGVKLEAQLIVLNRREFVRECMFLRHDPLCCCSIEPEVGGLLDSSHPFDCLAPVVWSLRWSSFGCILSIQVHSVKGAQNEATRNDKEYDHPDDETAHYCPTASNNSIATAGQHLV
jgi:hypothetical protein